MLICSRRALSRSPRPVHVLSYSRSKRLYSLKATATVASARAPVSVTATPPKSLEQALKPQALTLFHKVSSLLPRILPSSGHSIDSLELWNQLLDHAYNILSEPASYTQARIVVFGIDEYSGAHDLITTLLDDTISCDTKHSELIHGRQTGSTLVIEHDHVAKLGDGHLRISSQWLRQFPVQVQIVELPLNGTGDHLKTLLSADFPVIVVNPVTMPLSSLLDSYRLPLNHPNAIIVITGVRTQQIDDFVQSLLDNRSNTSKNGPKVLYIDPSRALSSLQTFKADSSSLKSIDTYQYGSLSSGIHDLQKVIYSRMYTIQKSSGSEPAFAIQQYTAISLLQRSLDVSRVVINNAKRETDDVCSDISDLRSRIAEMRVKLHGEVLGIFDNQSQAYQDDVRKALEKAKMDLKLIMDSFTWWKLLWHVDEISETVGGAVHRAWCKELEQQLILHTGRLSTPQQELSFTTTSLLSTFPPSSYFSSPVLTNTLSQLKTSPTYALTPTSLTTPLQKRKSQIIAYPTTRLHIKAQQVAVGMYGVVLGGVGISWAGWVGLTEPLAGLGAETSLGAGMLGAVLGLRWAVGSWEKAKKRWWEDLDRIGEGLSRDLKANLDKKVTENVVIVPETACGGLELMARTRKEQIAELEEQVDILEDELRRIN